MRTVCFVLVCMGACASLRYGYGMLRVSVVCMCVCLRYVYGMVSVRGYVHVCGFTACVMYVSCECGCACVWV